MSKLAWILVLFIIFDTSICEFSYDYWSIRHSMNVLQQLKEEVLPVLSNFKINANIQVWPIFHTVLIESYFQNKYNYTNYRKGSTATFDCAKWRKTFESKDFVEYHWKTKHSGSQITEGKFNDKTDKFAPSFPPTPKGLEKYVENVCLADYCDIFECKDYPDMILKHTAFNQRDYFDYEETRDKISEERMNYIKRTNKKLIQYMDKYDDKDVMETEGKDTVFKFNIRRYSPQHQKMMLEKCIDLFLNWITSDPQTSQGDIVSAYDFLYTRYCK